MAESDFNTEQPTQYIPHRRSKRTQLFGLLLGVIVIGGVIATLYWWLVGSKSVSTDNAYVQAEVAQITTSVGGIVQTVEARDTQTVKTGDVLVTLDPTDAQLALAQAEAELGRAERRVQGYLASDEGLSAQVTAREADQKRAAAMAQAAEADVKRAQIDLQRRQALAQDGSVSGEEVSTAQNALTVAQANLATAKAGQAQAAANRMAAIGTLNANQVLTADSTRDTNPEVALARAHRDQAQVNLERTTIKAPIDGVIARRQVQVGQKIEQGAPLMMIVPITETYVEANFKEVQLSHVKIGQKVELESDLYGSDVVYHGTVAGFSGGTGSAFALIPAQNATGNWIKVVQRLPVRITLDKAELQQHPLQVGLSMEAKILFE